MLVQKQIRGLETGWLVEGPESGPILLFLHGFPDDATIWRAQMEFFKEHFQVVAPYIRGAGPSEPAEDVMRYGPDSVGLDLLEILAEVDPSKERKVYCIGHDLGGVHAWHVARLLQSRLGGLVIINSLTIAQMLRRFKNIRQLKKSWYIFLMQVPVLPERLLGKFPQKFVTAARRLGGLKENLSVDVDSGAVVAPLNQYRAFFRAIGTAGRQAEQRLQAPVLVLWGENDAFLEPPSQDEMETEAEQVTIRILPGNHWLHREDPDRINGLIDEFIKKGET